MLKVEGFVDWKTMGRKIMGRHHRLLEKSGVCISMTWTMGRGKCFPQPFSELLWSKVAVQPDDRGDGQKQVLGYGLVVCGYGVLSISRLIGDVDGVLALP